MRPNYTISCHKLEGAQQISSPNFNTRPKDTPISLLVIHNISLPPGEYDNDYIERFFVNQLPIHEHEYFACIEQLQVSAHLLIKRDGHVVQFVDFDQRAWHAGVSSFCGQAQCNDYSIGIELQGSDYEAFTSEQYQVLADVTDALQCAYPAISDQRIVGHSDIAPARKTDPGPCFDWARYRQALKLRTANRR